jgi:succinyl-diaminopimelate desuccinylase
MLAPALAELTEVQWDQGNEHFPPTTFQVSNINAGTGAGNIVPGALTMRFNFRFSPESTIDGLKTAVMSVLERHGVDGVVDWRVYAEPFLTPRGRLVNTLSAAIEHVTGRVPALSTAGGTSDARFLAAIATEVVEFGGINATIHQVNEHMPMADFAPLSRIYEETIARLLTA